MFNATPLLRLYANRRLAKLAAMNSVATQSNQLVTLLRTAKDTKFGKDHGFGEIRSVAEYQKRVPLRKYEQFWNEYFKPAFPRLENIAWPGLIRNFAVSSGTSSGVTKYLPLTPEMLASNQKAGLDLLSFHLAAKPDSRIFGGKSFLLGGSTELVEQSPGVFSGDLSGITVKEFPWWVKLRYFPPPELALLKNWEEKIDILARRALAEPITMISGVPSWMIIFLGKLAELRPEARGKIAQFFPKLEMITHGGVNFSPYRKQFLDALEGSPAELREVYPASEGFIATADRGYGDGLRLQIDSGIFYEFVPLEELGSPHPTRHWVENIETDTNYAVVLTTCAGLWSYVIGDTVRFVDKQTPRLLVTGRTSYYLSAFGEHLIAEEVEDGATTAANENRLVVADYSVGALFPEKAGELGGHLWVVEFAGPIPGNGVLENFAISLDRKLCQRNEDYEAHRAKGFGLKPPQILAVPPGTFADWMKSRGKLGGQNKVPRIITDRDLFANLRAFANTARGGSA